MAFSRSPDVSYEVVDGRAVLVDIQGKELITLNPVGTLIWDLLDGERDVAALAGILASQFSEVTVEELETDISRFLVELHGDQLILDDTSGD